MALEIQKTLVLSTCHLTRTTASMLDGAAPENWPAAGGLYGEYGYFIHALDEASETSEVPDDLWLCMQFARAVGCLYILFDEDGYQLADLPKYDG